MSHTIASVAPIKATGIQALSQTQSAGKTDFSKTLNQALDQVSAAQKASGAENKALVQGKPGASLEKAVEASAHARVDWNATVAVRNSVVNAYKTIMNMPV